MRNPAQPARPIFEHEERGDVTVMSLRATLVAQAAADLKPQMVAIADSGARKLVVDLAQLKLIDSLGISALIALFKHARSLGGRVFFTGLNAQPRAVFSILHLDRSLELCATVDEAMSKLAAV